MKIRPTFLSFYINADLNVKIFISATSGNSADKFKRDQGVFLKTSGGNIDIVKQLKIFALHGNYFQKKS